MKATGRDIEVRGYIESIVRLDDINTLDIRHQLRMSLPLLL